MTGEIVATREELADYAHNAWSGWMRHMFRLSQDNADGTVTIPENLVRRWKGLSGAEYYMLSEKLKDADRKEADRILNIVRGTKGD